MVHDHQKRPIEHPDPGGADASAEAAMYRMMVENTSDLIIRYDRNRVRTYVSPVAREMLCYDPEELLGRRGYDMNHPDDRERAIKAFHSIGLDQPRDKQTFRVQRKDGVYIWVETLFRYLAEDGGVISVSRDITARKHAEELLAETNRKLETANRLLRALAQQDGLTGLANRRCFDEVLQTEFRRADREHEWLGLVLIDVDYFKAYNDLYGHLAGDECLRRISAAVAQSLRRPADLAARYGGEELVVVLPATDQLGTTRVAERICGAVAALRIEHRGNSEGIATVSAGATSDIPLSRGDDSPTRLIEAADQALYQAKRDGRNRVCSTIPRQREVQVA